MKILILGHLVLDEIHAFDGSVYESAGGIVFPLTALASVVEDDDRMFAVFPYGSDAASVLDELRTTYPEINLTHCWSVPDATTRVRLFHETRARYNTQLVRALSSIPSDRFFHLLPEVDLVYVNMMTGQDISLDDASALRGPGRMVYLDLHMLAYKAGADGHRSLAALEDWRAWAGVADVLHCNEHEFAFFLASEPDALKRRELLFETATLKYLVITKGERGADIYLNPDRRLHVPVVQPTAIIDPTGCGDAFGSILAWGLARGDTLEDAARRAARAASFVVSIPGSRGMRNMRHVFGGAEG